MPSGVCQTSDSVLPFSSLLASSSQSRSVGSSLMHKGYDAPASRAKPERSGSARLAQLLGRPGLFQCAACRCDTGAPDASSVVVELPGTPVGRPAPTPGGGVRLGLDAGPGLGRVGAASLQLLRGGVDEAQLRAHTRSITQGYDSYSAAWRCRAPS